MTGTAQYHGGAAGDYAKRDKGDAARQGRADKFFTAPPNRRRTSWATFRLQTRLRKSGRRVVRGGVRCSPAANGAPERVSPQPLADRSTGPSDHSAQHPADCTQMRATRRIPGEAKGGRLPLGHRSRTTGSGAPPYPRIGSPTAPTRTDTSYREGLCITSRTAGLAEYPQQDRCSIRLPV
jgi:hypothetical protein